ncbi:hypothetical protein IWT25_02337 [Secundilactobacillus pentosiphilus]|uniref:IrrE N-terminal-like domain-containing protein n=1 Tax=Secundilactobacillus pentosiphilus TaxID=1714682 RepID=A0A1Z5IZA5_9LACO|nr:ImmA/IrrE family metallo-endopeptidase [Secundilactobacillus pentosiphilus]GAX06989.1 hypothetical protein IWT25_02337 [Secundilactobacillus pentosiphilus]
MAYGYKNLNYCDLQEAYDEALINYSDLANDIAYYFDTKTCNLRTNDYVHYCELAYHVEFVPFTFTGKPKRIFAGSLMIGNHGFYEIGFNSSVNEGRQNFTKLHEINHLVNDVQTGKPGQSFSDVFARGDYSPEEQYCEAVANFGAAMMQIPEEALVAMILKTKNLKNEFSKEFSSSYGANYNRLLDYLMYQQKLNFSDAQVLANDYEGNPLTSGLSKVISSNVVNNPEYINIINSVILYAE